MKFTRTKQLVFTNNKGGVGKTTLAFNTAVKIAELGYKVVLVDLDPQCNLTRLCLGESWFSENLFSDQNADISDILRGIVEGGSDIDTSVSPVPLNMYPNIGLVPGSPDIVQFENLLTTAIGQAAGGQQIGYFTTSAIDRYLRGLGMKDEIDVFIIDTSPTFGLLNRVILLGVDYFVVPLMPDAFSVQGIQNLGSIFADWKEQWKVTAKALGGNIETKYVLDGEGLFIGYTINSYNVYANRPVKKQAQFMELIPQRVQEYLSEKHSKNGLVATSYKQPLQNIQDYGQLPELSQEKLTAIFDLPTEEISKLPPGSSENYEKSKTEFGELAKNIIATLDKY
jgi:cellulose biosynthesis protein BcsQ